MRAPHRIVVLTQRFAERWRRLAAALDAVAARPKSKWRIRRESAVAPASGMRAEDAAFAAAMPSQSVLDTKADFQAFLQAVRIFARARSEHGTYCRRSLEAGKRIGGPAAD
jgi:hypothetical protein